MTLKRGDELMDRFVSGAMDTLPGVLGLVCFLTCVVLIAIAALVEPSLGTVCVFFFLLPWLYGASWLLGRGVGPFVVLAAAALAAVGILGYVAGARVAGAVAHTGTVAHLRKAESIVEVLAMFLPREIRTEVFRPRFDDERVDFREAMKKRRATWWRVGIALAFWFQSTLILADCFRAAAFRWLVPVHLMKRPPGGT